MPGELSRIMTCEWHSENTHVVLEIPSQNENSKATEDSTRAPWKQVLGEMEKESITDPTINNHELLSPMTDGPSS